ncbi:Rv1355c family protein [Mycobacterium sp. CVI_P3]|uniref:Rv1355c family protein n=1 Tax=Mycobacterium pinniadriaticum TaxID=2994102 RepID=A0ABT3SJV0_9MYCO|nr:Rv1355c family protein [Mycobacterium pinniadriaticum]MCX2932780.1 Rv1355c family protein [Mycobacterium pinniadriaticum]MCX2939160.1 Rv1355c family protein [Mycobacterium pinniadriaticum]
MDETASFTAAILSDGDSELDRLRSDPHIEFIDHRAALLDNLRGLHPVPAAELLDEPTRWAHYPWRRTVVAILGPNGFRAVRTDRNRNLITTTEQQRLAGVRIGIAGLSVGHVIAHTLAAEGLCGALRLADFDHLELSNLNRVPATILDIGINKAVVTARRIAELDPYLHVEVMTAGVRADSLEDFLDDIDIVVEECDSLDMKVRIREAARERRLPVLMATSDRGLIDVERFDLEPDRPVMHGVLGGVDSTQLSALSQQDRIPYMLRHLDAGRSSGRLTASLVEVGHTLSTWPQLAGEVALGATTVAEAARRIGLGEPLRSGQVRIDIGQALDEVAEPALGDEEPVDAADAAAPGGGEPGDAKTAIALAAVRAPSGGNAQPWDIDILADAVRIRLAPQYTSMMDVAFRGSAVAVGAAAFNARVAAAKAGVLGSVEWATDGPALLEVTLRLAHGEDPRLADLYQPMLRRETNRNQGNPKAVPTRTIDALHAWAAQEGAGLHLLTERDDIFRAAEILASTDRLRFLTPRLHQEMISEMRWPGDQPADSGIDVRGLELDPGDLAVMEILRRPDVMELLANWDAGDALGDDVAQRVRATSAVAVVTTSGDQLIDYARGGSAAEAIWIVAQQHGLAVHPISPVFLHAVHRHELCEMSPFFASRLVQLQSEFAQLAGMEPDESLVLVLRLAHAGPASTRSRRRPGHRVD